MSTLRADQRWLLLHMGGWAIIDALLSPAGTDQLMGRMWGSTGGEPPAGAPEWLRGWETRSGRIVSPGRGEPRVVITSAQLKRYVNSLCPEVRAELEDCRNARLAETQRTRDWCHCPWQSQAPNPHSQPCQRNHPTDHEDQQHLSTISGIAAWESALLRRALAVVTGQLPLFDAHL
jgi:hypothetical protein